MAIARSGSSILRIGSGAMSVGGVSETFDYYIATSGSDSNPGTEAEPWAITAINTKQGTYAGTRLGLLDGTYDVSAVTPPDSYEYAAFLQVAPGTEGSPTVIQAVNARQAILDCGDEARAAIGRYTSSPSGHGWTEIRALVVRNSARFGIQFSYENSTGDGVPGIVIDGCEVYNIIDATDGDNTDAIWFSEVCDSTISNNYLHDIDNGGSTHNASGVKLYGSTRITIEYNTVANAICGFYPKGNGVSGTQIRYNYIYDCVEPLAGFYSQPADGETTRVHHNIVEFDTVTTANYLWLTDNGGVFINQQTEVYNNTFDVPSSYSGGVGLHLACNIDSVLTYYNNILLGDNTGGTNPGGDWWTNSAARIVLIDYNRYNNCRWVLGSTAQTTIAGWRTATGGEAGSSVGDPSFVGSGTGAAKFKLDGGSACIGAGRVGGVSGGDAVNMGAFESSGQTERIGCNFGLLAY